MGPDALPTHTLTFLFTDLVGSTARSAGLPRGEADRLRHVHFGLLRAAVAPAGGREVKNLGDGLMVAFDSASRAITCAVAMQEGLARHNRRTETPLEVRVGVAMGEAVEEDGDYFGDAVVEAARLCALATGGQILTTGLVRATLGRRAEAELARLGERELKGLPDPVEVWEVRWAPPPASEVAPPLPGRLAATPSLPFVGRSAQIQRLTRAWKAVVAGERRAVFVSGEPGIGKTRLVREVAADAHDAGATVLLGTCEEELDMPFRPWVEALDHLVAAVPAEVVDALGPRRLADLARVVPAVAERLPAVEGAPAPRVTGPDAESERYLFFTAVAALLAAAARAAPVVVVLDDLQWADRPSLSLLRHVIESPEPGAVLILGTYRDAELGAEHPLAAVLASMRRDEGVERLSLGGLEDGDLVELVAAMSGSALDTDGIQLAHQLRRETDGNPFFAAEVVRHLADTDSMAASAVELRLPESVREVVGHRVARLGEGAHATLAMAAVVGADFDLDLLAAASGAAEDLVLDHVDAAEAAGLVRSTGAGSFRFAHAIVRHTLYEELSPTRRARLHRRVATALESPGPVERHPAELARHWTAAASPADVTKAVDYNRRAGDAALASLAPDQAIEHYRTALDLLRQHGPDELLECELRCSLAEAMRDAGDPAFRSLGLAAAEQAHRLGSTDLLVRAALIAYKLQASGYDPDRARVLRLALAAVGPEDAGPRVHLLAALSMELLFTDGPVARTAGDEAIAIARRLGDERLLYHALANTGRFAWDEHGLAKSIEALAIAQTQGDQLAISAAAQALFEAAVMIGERELAEEGKDLMVAATQQTVRPDRHWILQYTLADWATMTGDLERAEELIEACWDLGRRTGQPGAIAIYASHLTMLHWHRGDAARAASLVAEAAASDPYLSVLHVDLGGGDLARQVAELPVDGAWLLSLGLLAEAVARSGDRALIADVYDRLLPYERLLCRGGPLSRGPIAHLLALLAAADDRVEVALGHFADADTMNRRLRWPIYTARTQLAWARLLLAQGDAERARALFADALATARSYGYAAIERRAAQLLAVAGEGRP